MARLLFANSSGEISDHPYLELAVQSASCLKRIPDCELIPLPEGSELFLLPGRLPVGWNDRKTEFEAMERIPGKFRSARKSEKYEKYCAVAAFPAPGYTRTYLPAYRQNDKAPCLPLWAYTAAGWDDKKGIVIAATRVDYNPYWDEKNFDPRRLASRMEETLAKYPDNRLYRHLAYCAKGYNCCNARNLFYGRGEAPLPVSSSCDSRCVGCISYQEKSGFQASHHRISFLPEVKELLEVAVPHLERGTDTIVSFGQGCEGEPLLCSDRILETIRSIRQKTGQGTIHINSNGSRPDVLPGLAEAGLNTIRISLNSTQEDRYMAYYRPKNYQFAHVRESIKISVQSGLMVSLNYLIFPGITDLPEEMEGLVSLIRETGLQMVQMRNLGIDPEYYLKALPAVSGNGIGIETLIRRLKKEFPNLIIGYFNRPKYSFPCNASFPHSAERI